MCRECGWIITYVSSKTSVQGAHMHTFANPHGIVYEIGCFSDAPGCAHAGPSTPEFTWFAGFSWRVAVCGKCLAHLGWRFTAKSGAGFYGLILDRLIFPV